MLNAAGAPRGDPPGAVGQQRRSRNSYYYRSLAIISNSYYYRLIAIINNSYYYRLIAIINNSYYSSRRGAQRYVPQMLPIV